MVHRSPRHPARNVASSSAAGNQAYVDIVGFAVFRIQPLDSNTVYGYAISGVNEDPKDSNAASRSGGAAGALELAEGHGTIPPGGASAPTRRSGRRNAMEMEYKDPSKRGRWLVLLGVVLAVVAGGAAFYLINNAQQQAGQSGLKTTSAVVAVRRDPRPQADRGRGRHPAQRHPARRHQRRGHRDRPGHGRRPHPRGRGQARPAAHHEPARVDHGRRRVLDPRTQTRPSPPSPRRGAPCP